MVIAIKVMNDKKTIFVFFMSDFVPVKRVYSEFEVFPTDSR